MIKFITRILFNKSNFSIYKSPVNFSFISIHSKATYINRCTGYFIFVLNNFHFKIEFFIFKIFVFFSISNYPGSLSLNIHLYCYQDVVFLGNCFCAVGKSGRRKKRIAVDSSRLKRDGNDKAGGERRIASRYGGARWTGRQSGKKIY